MSAASPTTLPLDPMLRARMGRQWALTVLNAFDLTPRMRRVELTGAALDEFTPKPGQEMILVLPQPGGEAVRRHYTIRSFDLATQRLAIDVVLHGDTPGANWAREATPGDPLEAWGPRGRIVPAPQADWHVVSADETGLPGMFAIIESLPADVPVHAFLEVATDAERQALTARAAVTLEWFSRNGKPAGGSPLLADALAGFTLPAGRGHAYLTGETAIVRAQRQGLLARGLGKDQIAAEGYWRPGRVGGHDHVDRD